MERYLLPSLRLGQTRRERSGCLTFHVHDKVYLIVVLDPRDTDALLRTRRERRRLAGDGETHHAKQSSKRHQSASKGKNQRSLEHLDIFNTIPSKIVVTVVNRKHSTYLPLGSEDNLRPNTIKVRRHANKISRYSKEIL